ncbi:MAG: hypothetical protein V1799_18815 [bacterium]
MALPQKTDQIVSLSIASKLTRNYRDASPKETVRAGGFWKEYLQKLLDQSGCVAMRIYYARKDDGASSFVLVGINEKGDDINDGILLEEAYPCPPWCDDASALGR